MIITITLNPAIDRTLVLEAPVELSAVNSQYTDCPSGR